MTSRAKDAWPTRVGLPLGLALAALAVSGWVMPEGDPPKGATTSVTVGPTGALGVAPAGQIARATDLRAGGGVTGRFTVRNESGDPQAVSLRMALPSHDLDTRLHVQAALKGRTVTEGSLASARAWSSSVVLRPGERSHVRLRVSIPAGVSDYEYRRADARIEMRSVSAR